MIKNAKSAKSVKRKKGKRFFRVLLILLAVLFLAAIPCVIYATTRIKNKMDAGRTIDNILMTTTDAESILYHYEEIDGKRTLCVTENGILHGAGWCIPVRYEEIPEDLIFALISIEDKRFFQHHGVDIKRTLLAGVNYFFHYGDKFGASTITQQLIKNLTGDSEQTPDRKLREISAAYRLEEEADKTEILEAYLNLVNFAQGCYGIGAASMRYFGKNVGDLTLEESASIVAIANNPGYYDPITHPENNRERRNLILTEMKEQGYITEERYIAAVQSPVDTSNGREREKSSIHSWYTDMVITDVINDLCTTYGYTPAQASVMVYNGGLRIETCMNPTIQKTVEAYFSDPSHFSQASDDEYPQCAAIVIDPQTGDILGVAGRIGEKAGDRVLNLATDALHPTGSVIKPLSAYAPALELGHLSWASVFDDSPVRTGHGRPWPQNANHCYRGPTDVPTALLNSTNTVAVRVLENCVGIDRSFAFLQEHLGMKNLIAGRTENGVEVSDKNSVALGLGQLAHGVTLREITGGYTIFTDGVYHAPRSYYRVYSAEGELLLSRCTEREAEVVLSRENAAIMTQLLKNVAQYGTGGHLQIGKRVECAGKTGTTQNNCDRWFIGYTPELLAGVWTGHEYPHPMDDLAGNPCLDVWNDLIRSCYQANVAGSVPYFQIPDTLIRATYCKETGLLATTDCAGHISTGWFVPGTEPRTFCHACTGKNQKTEPTDMPE